MARFPYTKLNAKVNQEVKEISVEGVDALVEVRQYLPVDEKLGLIGRVIELAHDTNNFSNPLKVEVYLALEVIQAYTNITFTEKQKENVTKLYDSLVSSGWIDKIYGTIPKSEMTTLVSALEETIKAFYAYRNSVLGVMEAVSQDYDNLNFDINSLQEKLGNSENVELLRDILGRLG